MALRVAINGFGRIGRNIVRALYENNYDKDIKIIAINDLGDAKLNAHLLEYDTTHGHFAFPVSCTDEAILVNQDRIITLAEKDPTQLPWQQLKIDIVFECTGRFTKRAEASKHLQAGAKKVLISGPSAEADLTTVFGVNDDKISQAQSIISCASCTTNCLAPVAKALHEGVGIEKGFMTTIHAFTNDQVLCDTYHKDPYRARSAMTSMIPTKTGAATAVGLVLPELQGRLDGFAMRVPIINVSVVDLTFYASRITTKEEIHQLIDQAALHSQVLAVNSKPLVSIDFNHNAFSSIFDKNHTRVNGNLVKVLAWYDNEWGFSNRMLDVAKVMQRFL